MTRLGAAIALAATIVALTVSCAADEGAAPDVPVASAQTVQAVERPFTSTVVLEALTVAPSRVTLERVEVDAEIHWQVDDGSRVLEGELVAVEAGADGGLTVEELERELERAGDNLAYVAQIVELDRSAARWADRTTRARTELEATRAVAEAEDLVAEATARRDRALARTRQITAPFTGTFHRHAVGGSGEIGWVVADAPAVEAVLDPLVRLRLPDPIPSVSVVIAGAPDAVGCAAVEVRDPARDADSPQGRLRCELPAEIVAFAGLPATMTIEVADIPRAVTVPVDAVRPGTPGHGQVVVLSAGGARTTRTVELGPTDGVAVVVTAGLEAGEVVELLLVDATEDEAVEG